MRLHEFVEHSRVRLLVDNLLRRALIHVGMRFELKEEVKPIDEKKNNTGTAADFEHFLVRVRNVFILEGGMERSLEYEVSYDGILCVAM
jgi:hypothetical protein